jgi:lipoate-protein ligase A
MRLHHGPLAGGDPSLELALAHALVKRVSSGELGDVLRVYRPTAPVTVFGRRDTRLPGFTAAVGDSRAAGFEPLVRATGGRAVAYTGSALVVDHAVHDVNAVTGQDYRFERFGQMFADVFRRLGVDARVGAVPGEYCPGAQSVNARGLVKLVGTAQRVIRDAWLFSSLIVVGDETRVRAVLAKVYGHLGQPFDEASVGSLTGEVPALSIETVERAIIAAYAAVDSLDEAALDDETLALARDLAAHHRV